MTFTELNRRIKPLGAISICSVYDSIEVQCSLAKAAEVIAICYDILDNWPVENFKFLKLPIGCEGDIGVSWGETKVVHPGITQAEVEKLVEETRQDSIKTFGSWLQ